MLHGFALLAVSALSPFSPRAALLSPVSWVAILSGVGIPNEDSTELKIEDRPCSVEFARL